MTKYLIIGSADVGDMIEVQGLFITLKQQDQEALIDVLAPPSTFPLLSRMPEVHEAILMSTRQGAFALKESQRVGKALKGKGYDQAIIMTHSWKLALVAWFAGVKQRNNWHGKWRSMLAQPLAKPALQVSTEAKLQASAQFNLDFEKPLLALCAGTKLACAKQWSAQDYADIAKTKVAQGWQVALFGLPENRSLADEINQLSSNVCNNLVGQVSLQATVDCLACADTVITHDSTLMHIAHALAKNVIAVGGLSNPVIMPDLALQQIEG